LLPDLVCSQCLFVGSITGVISNSKDFRTGTKITTSPVKDAKAGKIVTTESGSQYKLGLISTPGSSKKANQADSPTPKNTKGSQSAENTEVEERTQTSLFFGGSQNIKEGTVLPELSQ
jgi:hypothetical protein